jgi:hypothetical protein
MGCVKLHILDEQYKNTELKVSYFNKELTPNNSDVNTCRILLYAYCLNNPVRYVDPTGKDVWQLDEYGNVINTITHDADGNRLTYDRIEVHNGKGEVLGKTSDYELGTIQYSKVTVGEGNNAWSYDQFSVNGTENGISIFQTVADNTKVEWSHGIFGESGAQSNFLTTTHNEWNEGGMRDIWIKNYMQGISIVEHTHNHPTHKSAQHLSVILKMSVFFKGKMLCL